MKYMTFNNSCFFTALANLLEEFNINVEDRDIVKDSLIPYIFRYDSNDNKYIAGYQIQETRYINHYLKRYNLVFQERKYSKGCIAETKKNLVDEIKYENNIVVSLKVLEDSNSWHATIYKGYIDNKFIFLNMKRKASNEPIYYKLTYKELLDKLADIVQYGYITEIKQESNVNLKSELLRSLIVLESYQKELIQFCSKKTTYKQRITSKDKLFRALFLSYIDVAEILGNKKLLERLAWMQTQMIKTYSLDFDLLLCNYIKIDLVNNIFYLIKNQIKERIDDDVLSW